MCFSTKGFIDVNIHFCSDVCVLLAQHFGIVLSQQAHWSSQKNRIIHLGGFRLKNLPQNVETDEFLFEKVQIVLQKNSIGMLMTLLKGLLLLVVWSMWIIRSSSRLGWRLMTRNPTRWWRTWNCSHLSQNMGDWERWPLLNRGDHAKRNCEFLHACEQSCFPIHRFHAPSAALKSAMVPCNARVRRWLICFLNYFYQLWVCAATAATSFNAQSMCFAGK